MCTDTVHHHQLAAYPSGPYNSAMFNQPSADG